ncbi:Crp/Fnr family transcriptional regulator [Brevundimonas sp. NPDC090276]|uniref:Crp/Fnr family transcriptional regulator n=1 Tax=Brevundimonas sp. NPDC090276 TaxID=3363956 RepID=UPI00383AB2C5
MHMGVPYAGYPEAVRHGLRAAPTARAALRRPLRPPADVAALRVLSAITTLSEDERSLVRKLCLYRESIPAGAEFAREGEPAPARLIVSGWACRQQSLPDGRRQIFGFLMAGDTIGIGIKARPLDELSTVAVTRVECVDALMLREILAVQDGRHAGLQNALAAVRRYEEACLLDHVVRLGRQSAHERTAHFLLEWRQRCRIAGLAEGERFPMPLTQEVLSDALGLSIVHLNRTLQHMKREGLIEVKRGWIALLDIVRLKFICDYQARYPVQEVME